MTDPRPSSTADRWRAAAADATEVFDFRLYISGLTPRSTRAVETVRRLCDVHLAGRYSLEVVDVYQHPEQARRDQVVATPTLVKLLPQPMRRFIGDLSDANRLLARLGLATSSS